MLFMKFKVMTLNQISATGLARLPGDLYTIVGDWKEQPDAVLVRSQVMHDLAIPSCVKAIVRAGAGVNNIPVADCSQKGIAVFNTPGANACAVKELTLTGMLLGIRGSWDGMNFVQGLRGKNLDHAQMSQLVEKEKKKFVGNELNGKTLGVIGLGAIGAMVCDAALALGMRVVGYDPMLSVEGALRISPKVRRMDEIRGVLACADVITLHLPALAETKNLMNRDLFSHCKKGALLVNYARGEIVDRTALIEAIQSGQIKRYVCDFPDGALLELPQVIVTPHLGASTNEAEENCALMAVDQLRDFIEHGNVKNAVNLPACHLDRSAPHRMTVTSRESAQSMSHITTAFSKAGCSIAGMMSKSAGGTTYTIFDSNTPISENLVAMLKGIDGVIHTRIL